MTYDFDTFIDRQGTGSIKWEPDSLEATFGKRDLLPLWIADMDFKAPQPILDALDRVVRHGIFGYTHSDAPNQALSSWMMRRHQWHDCQPEWIVNTPGIVCALNVAVQTYTRPGDKVLIQRPVYYPFSQAIENNGRHVCSSALIEKEGAFHIDFEDFEKKASDPLVTLLILCSPHNPLSLVYTAEELEKMIEIATRHHVQVVVDEIHGDLIMPGTHYTSVGSLAETYLDQVIVCLAPSKTFNLAGMQWSGIVIKDQVKRAQFERTLTQFGYHMIHPLSMAAVTAAYEDCEPWLDGLIDYVYANYLYLKERLEQALPGVRVLDLEATYLAFVDMRVLGLSAEQLMERMVHQAGVALDAGDWFGPEGAGFMRFNLACPRCILVEATDQIIEAFTASN